MIWHCAQAALHFNQAHNLTYADFSVWEVLIIVVIIGSVRPLYYHFNERFQQRLAKRMIEENQFEYDSLLNKSNPFYSSLDQDGKDLFLERTVRFMNDKNFHYLEMDSTPDMSMLVSAAAIQLTFGLDKYLLDYFKDIYVLKNKYQYGLSAVPYEGHVSSQGIYLSWKNFQTEYGVYDDGQNVGLHEMAHALTYVNFTVRDGEDQGFRSRFQAFSPVARPIFEKVQAGEITFFGSYAGTNYDEFWAVCVETFFERAMEFHQQLPELYAALARLLNQDPLTREKRLIPSAGMAVPE